MTYYKTLQKKVNYDLFSLHKWLTANKICLNEAKSKQRYFRKSGSAPTLNIKLHGKPQFSQNLLNMLELILNEFLSGDAPCSEKLNRANGMLAKARHYEIKN